MNAQPELAVPGLDTPDYKTRLANHRALVAEIDALERARTLPQQELFQVQPPAPTDPDYPGDDFLVGLVVGAYAKTATPISPETAREWLEQYPHFPF